MSELNYFAALLHANDATALRLIDPERDLSAQWLKVYEWIIAFQRDNGRLPKPLTVAGTWQVPLSQPPETAEVYAKQIKTNAKRARLESELSHGVVPHLEGHDPDKAMEATAEALGKIRTEFPEPDDSRAFLPSMSSNVDERWRAYQFRQHHRGVLGLPFPWPTMTRMTLGMQPGEAIALVARPNIGKSWALIVMAVYLWQMGKRVLFASMETPPRSGVVKSERARERLGEWGDVVQQRLTTRFDAIASRVSAWRFLRAQLNPHEEREYQRYLEMCRDPQAHGWGELRIVSSPLVRTIGQLEQEAIHFDPDVIMWDSAYLAINRGGGRQKRTDAAGYFLEDCKHTFERLGVPGVLTWHFNRDVDENDIKASQNDIALTDDMPRLFDVILALFRTPEMIDAGEAVWRSLKIRDGVNIPELRTQFEIKRHVAFAEMSFGVTGEAE